MTKQEFITQRCASSSEPDYMNVVVNAEYIWNKLQDKCSGYALDDICNKFKDISTYDLGILVNRIGREIEYRNSMQPTTTGE